MSFVGLFLTVKFHLISFLAQRIRKAIRSNNIQVNIQAIHVYAVYDSSSEFGSDLIKAPGTTADGTGLNMFSEVMGLCFMWLKICTEQPLTNNIDWTMVLATI